MPSHHEARFLFAAIAAFVVSAGVLAPVDAECCSALTPQAYLQFPAEGQQVPPDVRIHVVSYQQPNNSVFPPYLLDSDGHRVPVDVPSNYGYSHGLYSSFAYLNYVAPQQPLEPGTYSLTFGGGDDNPTTTFEVSADLAYPTPPPIDSVEWVTRVFATEQVAPDSCKDDFLQQSRVTFPRPDSAQARHTLFYLVNFTTIGEFDGDLDRTGDWTGKGKTAVVIDSDALRADHARALGTVDENIVTLTARSRFKAECIEITAVDMTGQRGDTLVKCRPDRCATPPTVQPWHDGWESFEDIDWAGQPDCAQEYCYSADCEPPSEPDAGTPGADTGPDPSDASNDTDPADVRPADAADVQADAMQDGTNDSADTTTPNQPASARGGEGCCCATVADSSPIPGAALLIAAVLGGAWLSRRRAAPHA